jgi:hypothetical protein
MSYNNSNNSNDDQNYRLLKRKKKGEKVSWIVLVFIILWVLIGAWAYVTSFMCTHERYSGSDAQKVGMMLLAGLLGPLWFLILPFVKRDGYCQLKK